MATRSHPLQFKWNYWFFKGMPTDEEKKRYGEVEAYRNCHIKIDHEIGTVQDFWVCFMELPKPSGIAAREENKQGFILCRSGVRPEWEDAELKQGGVWTWIVDTPSKVDDFWKYLLMAAIGQQFTTANLEEDEIVAVQNELHSKKTRIKIWHKRAEKKDAIRDRLKELCEKRLDEPTLWVDSACFHKKIEK